MTSPHKINPHAFEEQIKRLGLTDVAESCNIKIQTKVDEWLDRFITLDKSMIEMKSRVKKLVNKNMPVLILGETGTGKELIANALHGERVGKFVAVNCGGIPDTLLESEFFGCEKGAFTGAYNSKGGYFEEAINGTLFLDEIGELPKMLQCKLLRVLQEMKVRRIGSTKEIPVNCRVISATNRSRQWLLTDKHFRKDLYFRVAATSVELKPLRERVKDIEEICRRNEIDYGKYQSLLEGNTWEGNVRELLNVIGDIKSDL